MPSFSERAQEAAWSLQKLQQRKQPQKVPASPPNGFDDQLSRRPSDEQIEPDEPLLD